MGDCKRISYLPVPACDDVSQASHRMGRGPS